MIRHATGEHMADPSVIIGRATDARLTQQGHAEAIMKGIELRSRGIQPERVVTSPAIRCYETGRLALLAMRLDLPIHASGYLHEMDQGQVVGMKRAEFYTEARQSQIMQQGLDFSAPGGESPNQVANRGINFLDNQITKPESSIMAFTHGGLIAYTAGLLEGWDHEKSLAMRQQIAPVSETVFVFEDGHWQLSEFARP